MSKAGKRIAYVVMMLLRILNGGANACSTEDVKIKRAEVVVQDRTTYIVGEIDNECHDETGVQIHITLRDDAAEVVFAADFWPASLHNIPAQNSRWFMYVVSPAEPNPQRHPSRIEVETVALRKW